MEDVFINEAELEGILNLLQKEYKSDFSDYARTSLRRRMSRIKKLYNLHSLNDVERFLAAEPENLNTFIAEITVNTTEMYRDPEFWKQLRTGILPELEQYNNVRIWHAGCSSGEEPVSMAILLHELGLFSRAKIYATDINRTVLKRSAEVCYRIKDFKQAKENYIASGGTGDFDSYFTFSEEFFYLRNDLRTAFYFKLHNLVKDEPFTKVDLILCRNVMIYFNTALQSRAVRIFAESLFKGGHLAIGEKENIALLEEMKFFTQKNANKRIYKRL